MMEFLITHNHINSRTHYCLLVTSASKLLRNLVRLISTFIKGALSINKFRCVLISRYKNLLMPIHPHHEWSNPYKYIDKLFAEAMSAHNRDVSMALGNLQDVEYLDEALRDESFVDSIPYLSNDTIEGLQSGQLCRYRGLVQDMYGAELYSGAIGAVVWPETNKFRKVRISKYRDTQRTDYPAISQDLTDDDQDACYKDR